MFDSRTIAGTKKALREQAALDVGSSGVSVLLTLVQPVDTVPDSSSNNNHHSNTSNNQGDNSARQSTQSLSSDGSEENADSDSNVVEVLLMKIEAREDFYLPFF